MAPARHVPTKMSSSSPRLISNPTLPSLSLAWTRFIFPEPSSSSVPVNPERERANSARTSLGSPATSSVPTHTPGSRAGGASWQAESERKRTVRCMQFIAGLRAQNRPGGKSGNRIGTKRTSAGITRPARPLLDDLPQTLAVGAARHQLRSVAEDHRVFPVKPGLEALDGVDVDDRRPVHAEEAIGIEALLEAPERVPQEVLLAAGVDLHVVSRRLQPLDVGDADEVHRLAGADGDALLRAPLGPDGFQQREDVRLDAAARGLRQLLQHVRH